MNSEWSYGSTNGHKRRENSLDIAARVQQKVAALNENAATDLYFEKRAVPPGDCTGGTEALLLHEDHALHGRIPIRFQGVEVRTARQVPRIERCAIVPRGLHLIRQCRDLAAE